MNLRNFLQETDYLTGMMTKEELAAFIHEVARLLPEEQRAAYLENLALFENASGTDSRKTDPDGAKTKRKDGWSKSLKRNYETVMKNLRKIESGELELEASPNEEYDDWYNDEKDEFIFSDPEGIIQMLEAAADFIHQCVDLEAYEYGYAAAEEMIGLRIFAKEDDWGSFDDGICLDDLSYYSLSNMDYRKVVTDGLYLAYCANEMQERPDALYRMIQNSCLADLRLEEVMQGKEELKDIDQFLPLWVSCLGRKNDPKSQDLLAEALELLNDPDFFLETARKYSGLHPSLYEQYLEMMQKKGEYETCLAIGEEALHKIDETCVVRSRIAGILSVLAAGQGADAVEKYRLEQFRSDTTVTNFLLLAAESADASAFTEEISRIYQSVVERSKAKHYFRISGGERQENILSEDTAFMLAFLQGEFRFVKEQAMNVSTALGWSGTFMKCGLAAFLLLFFEGETLLPGVRMMCSKITAEIRFDRDAYQSYVQRPVPADTQECFWDCLKRWKKSVKISEEETRDYLKWLEGLIEKRVAGIMEANRRNYYSECAAFAAALGEALESRGEAGAKQRVLMQYRTRYSRRSSFHKELKTFGLSDKK